LRPFNYKLMNKINKKTQQLGDLDSLFHILVDDVIAASKTWKDNSCGFTRRSYIRTVITLIEGNTSRFKQAALWIHANDHAVFSPEEMTCLKEESVSLKENGKVHVKSLPIPLLTNLSFALDCYCRAMNKPFHLDKSLEGWQSLKKAVAIRNRITHPKSIDDLHISDEDLNIVGQASSFYIQTTKPLISE